MKDTDAYTQDAVVPNRAVGYTREEAGSGGGAPEATHQHLRAARALELGRRRLLDGRGPARVSTWRMRRTSSCRRRWTDWFFSDKSAQRPPAAAAPASARAASDPRAEPPGVNAVLETDLDTGYTIVVLSNLDPPSAESVAKKLREWLGSATDPESDASFQEHQRPEVDAVCAPGPAATRRSEERARAGRARDARSVPPIVVHLLRIQLLRGRADHEVSERARARGPATTRPNRAMPASSAAQAAAAAGPGGTAAARASPGRSPTRPPRRRRPRRPPRAAPAPRTRRAARRRPALWSVPLRGSTCRSSRAAVHASVGIADAVDGQADPREGALPAREGLDEVDRPRSPRSPRARDDRAEQPGPVRLRQQEPQSAPGRPGRRRRPPRTRRGPTRPRGRRRSPRGRRDPTASRRCAARGAMMPQEARRRYSGGGRRALR